MSRRAVLLVAACATVLIALGGLFLVGQARLRAEASVVHITMSDGSPAPADKARTMEAYVAKEQIWQSLHAGVIPEKAHSTMVDATGAIETRSDRSLDYLLVLVSQFAWVPSLAALPFVAGLALLIGTLFTAAAKWRPRVNAAP